MMGIRLLVVISLLFVCSSLSHAQKEAENWYFGNFAGLKFSQADPVPLLDGIMQTDEGCTTVSDTAGNLIFYTDGVRVFNRQHRMMPSARNLAGNPSSTQSSIVVQWPTRSDRFLIFTADANENNYRLGINYTEIDMRADGGMGDVAVLNTPLVAPATEKLTAVRHANGEDIWIIGHAMESDEFLIFLVTRNGVQTTPRRQAIGPRIGFGDAGVLKADPQGRKVAMATSVPLAVTLLDFDRLTGQLSNPISLPVNGPYGLEFSPNSRFLYATSFLVREIFQFDLGVSSDRIASTRQTVGTTAAGTTGAIQMAPNSRLYVAHFNESHISEIRYPDRAGIACDYRDLSVSLGDRTSRYGLPNFYPAVYSKEPEFEVVSTGYCAGDTIWFELRPPEYVENVRWTFDDPASGTANRATGQRVFHIFRGAGSYTVEAKFEALGVVDRNRLLFLDVKPRPRTNAGQDLTTCPGEPFRLRVAGASRYEWIPQQYLDNPESASPLARVDSTTTFVVRGYNDFGCFADDTVVVRVSVPAITVTSDTTICPGESVSLTASGADSYTWSPSDGLLSTTSATTVASPATTTRYMVVGRTTGCLDTSYVTVRVAPPVNVVVSPDVALCEGGTARLSASGGVQFVWLPTDGLSNPTSPITDVTPQRTTRYTVTVTTADGCSDTASVLVSVGTSLNVVAPPDTVVCRGATLSLSTIQSGTATWLERASGVSLTGSTVSITPTTTSYWILTISDGQCRGVDSVLVTVDEPAQLSSPSDTTVCEGVAVQLSVTGAQSVRWEPATFLNDPTSLTPVCTPSTTTQYTIIGGTGSCQDTTTMTVTVIPKSFLRTAVDDVNVVPGAEFKLPVRLLDDPAGALPARYTVSFDRRVIRPSFDTNNVIELDTADVGDRRSIDVIVLLEESANELFTMNVKTFLGTVLETSIDVVPSVDGCTDAAGGRTTLTVDFDQCGQTIRPVRFGPMAELTLTASPVPAEDNITVTWHSGEIGRHEVRLVDIAGRILYQQEFGRTVESPTSGSIEIPIDMISTAVMRCELRTLTSGTSIPVIRR